MTSWGRSRSGLESCASLEQIFDIRAWSSLVIPAAPVPSTSCGEVLPGDLGSASECVSSTEGSLPWGSASSGLLLSTRPLSLSGAGIDEVMVVASGPSSSCECAPCSVLVGWDARKGIVHAGADRFLCACQTRNCMRPAFSN